MTVAFFGHAQFYEREEYKQKIFAFLETKIGDLEVDMYFGGYGSFDNFAYNCCKKYQTTHPKISLILITPYITMEYQKNHLNYEQYKYDAIIYPEIEDKPLRFAISYRNKWMVEKADYVVTYVSHAWGGACSAYKYAKRKGKAIFNIGDLKDLAL